MNSVVLLVYIFYTYIFKGNSTAYGKFKVFPHQAPKFGYFKPVSMLLMLFACIPQITLNIIEVYAIIQNMDDTPQYNSYANCEEDFS